MTNDMHNNGLMDKRKEREREKERRVGGREEGKRNKCRSKNGNMFRSLSIPLSRKALGPIQPPIQRVPRSLSLRVKQPGREVDHSPPSSAEVKG
jgi:hypothetical protein